MTVDLDAGILDKRITIQETFEDDDLAGGVIDNWSEVITCWAQVKPLGAKQVYEYRSQNVKATHKIKVRGNISVTDNNRILYGSRIFEILFVENELEENVVKWVTCREVRS